MAGDKSEPNNKWFIISKQLRVLVHDISRASRVFFALTQHLLFALNLENTFHLSLFTAAATPRPLRNHFLPTEKWHMLSNKFQSSYNFPFLLVSISHFKLFFSPLNK